MTMVDSVSETEAMFREAASKALSADVGTVALESLGFWDLLPMLDDPEARLAALAVFRAQGRVLVESPALCGLLAQPYITGTSITPGTVGTPAWWNSPRYGTRQVVIADTGDRDLLLDRPGSGAYLVERDTANLVVLSIPGMPTMLEVTIDWSVAASQLVLAEPQAAVARTRSAFLGRLALAAEQVGAAEVAVEGAVSYAADREQFGQPIGKFQAVRHLLAWARTECVATENLIRQIAILDRSAPARYDEVVKALAGRNSRKACERSLQVLGGIGFTEEHNHHRHHSRVLALDALLGSSASLTAALGAWVRESGTVPGFPAAVIAPRLQ